MAISSPIESRHTGKGDPYGISKYGKQLNKRQKRILEKLQNVKDEYVFDRNDVSMVDLAALTARENVEFAMFTRGPARLVMRGDDKHVYVNTINAYLLNKKGWRWSGHTHVGDPLTNTTIKIVSHGDISVLRCFTKQKLSALYFINGDYGIFGKE